MTERPEEIMEKWERAQQYRAAKAEMEQQLQQIRKRQEKRRSKGSPKRTGKKK
tara:strand:+ start:586 stop:744 length:159 start_codon:yes stop_codon:yes gene_type:complete